MRNIYLLLLVQNLAWEWVTISQSQLKKVQLLYESEQRYSEMRKGEEFMSIFNKDALSSFLAYLAKKMIIMITTKNMKSAKQLMNHRVVQLGLNHNALFNNRKVTVSQLIHNKVSL